MRTREYEVVGRCLDCYIVQDGMEVEVAREGDGCAASLWRMAGWRGAGDGDVHVCDTSFTVTTAADIQGLCTFIFVYTFYTFIRFIQRVQVREAGTAGRPTVVGLDGLLADRGVGSSLIGIIPLFRRRVLMDGYAHRLVLEDNQYSNRVQHITMEDCSSI